MKRMSLLRPLAAFIVFFAILGFSSGCTVNQQFVDAIDAGWSVIGPEYERYVDSDPELDDRQKDNRRRTATLMTEAIETAKAQEKMK